MTGFVDRLAAMALGTPQPGAARLVLSPRFLPSLTAAPFDQSDALPSDDPTPVAQPLPSPAPQVSPRTATAQISPPRSAPEIAAHDGGTLTRTVEVARTRTGIETPAHLHRLVKSASATETESVQAAPTAMPPAPVARASVRDTRAEPGPGAPAAPLELTSARLRPVAPILTAADRTALAAPLSDISVASRIAQPRDERSVVHVTIDRIDVRAPAAAKSEPTAPRPRPQPAVSLTEYLRGERGSRG